MPNKLEVFGSNKTQEPKHNGLMLSMPEGGEH